MRLTFLLLACLAVFSCKQNTESANAPDTTAVTPPPKADIPLTLTRMQGKWVSTEDSLSTVTVKDNTWISEYQGSDGVIYDSMSIVLTDTIGDANSDGSRTLYLLLKKPGEDDLQYEVSSIDKMTMDLTYVARGNTLVYERVLESER